MAETRGRLGSVFANLINHAIPDCRAPHDVRERKLWAGDIIAAGPEANFKSTTLVIGTPLQDCILLAEFGSPAAIAIDSRRAFCTVRDMTVP
jgi:hypothetical protein